MIFWNFPYFRQTFLDQSLWIFNRLRWCNTLTIFYTFHLQKMTQISLSGKLSKAILLSTKNKWEVISVPTHFSTGIYFYLHLAKSVIFHIFMYDVCNKLWVCDIITSFKWIFIGTGQEVSFENMGKLNNSKYSKFENSYFPYFLSDFHDVCTIW